MFNAIQILLMLVVVALATLSILIGFQAFKLLRQLRQTVDKINLFLKDQDQNKLFSQLVDDDLLKKEQTEKTTQNQEEDSSPLVSVGLRGLKLSSSRSFYRNGRNLS